MPPAGGAIGSRCATHGTIHRARRAIRWCAAVPPAWPAAASATAARIRHRSTGRRIRHPRPDVAFLVSRPSHAPNMLMLGGIDSHSTCTFKHTFKTASKGLAATQFDRPGWSKPVTRSEATSAVYGLSGHEGGDIEKTLKRVLWPYWEDATRPVHVPKEFAPDLVPAERARIYEEWHRRLFGTA